MSQTKHDDGEKTSALIKGLTKSGKIIIKKITISSIVIGLKKIINKGGKFLKKLWCSVGGEYYKIIWFYQLS